MRTLSSALSSVLLWRGLCGAPAAHARKVNIENNVIKLEEQNWDIVMNKTTAILVNFYAPWCAACLRVQKNVDKAARRLKAWNMSDVRMGKLDVSVEMKVERRYDLLISGTPALLAFKNGQLFERYGGSTDPDDLIIHTYSVKLFYPLGLLLRMYGTLQAGGRKLAEWVAEKWIKENRRKFYIAFPVALFFLLPVIGFVVIFVGERLWSLCMCCRRVTGMWGGEPEADAAPKEEKQKSTKKEI